MCGSVITTLPIRPTPITIKIGFRHLKISFRNSIRFNELFIPGVKKFSQTYTNSSQFQKTWGLSFEAVHIFRNDLQHLMSVNNFKMDCCNQRFLHKKWVDKVDRNGYSARNDALRLYWIGILSAIALIARCLLFHFAVRYNWYQFWCCWLRIACRTQ